VRKNDSTPLAKERIMQIIYVQNVLLVLWKMHMFVLLFYFIYFLYWGVDVQAFDLVIRTVLFLFLLSETEACSSFVRIPILGN